MTPMLLTITRAAETLGVSRSKVYDEIHAGRLRAVKVGRRWRIPTAGLSEWIDRLDSNVGSYKVPADTGGDVHAQPSRGRVAGRVRSPGVRRTNTKGTDA